MRKVSKNRTEEDVISSTNGSLAEEAEPKSDTEEKDQDTDAGDDATVSDIAETNKRGKASKSKAKKRKSKQVTSNDEYEVEKIVDSKKIKGKLHYLIRWKGYSADSDTWEPENTLSCQDLINKFNDEKENSKDKEKETKVSKKTAKKRKGAKKESKSPAKKVKTEWVEKKGEENAEYEVEKILEVHHKKNGKREFLIHWKGWSSKFDSWEPESNLNCADLIKKFMEKVDDARTSDTRNLRIAPESTNRFTLQAQATGRRLSKRRGQHQRVRYDNAE